MGCGFHIIYVAEEGDLTVQGSISSPPVLEVRNVWMVYGATIALKDVSLTFSRGFHLIIGPNGSGKTTLLKIVSGVVKPSRGTVCVNGLPPARHALFHKPLAGGVLGDENPPFWMKAGEYLEEVINVSKCNEVCIDKIHNQAEKLGISSYTDKKIADLSTGMRKKLVILSGVISDAPVLVFDEPFSGLDKQSIISVTDILREEAAERTVIAATHIVPPEVPHIDSITVILNGVVKSHLERSLINEIRIPVIKAKISSKIRPIVPDDVNNLNPRKIELVGKDIIVMIDGPSYVKCAELGLCGGDYTIDIDTLLSIAYSA